LVFSIIFIEKIINLKKLKKMANSKVFVSPGVYTSEVDLSFVASSVGVTTLGMVGETLKGPAFEPIFIRNFDEFQTIFGGTTPEKFVNTQIPKYEAAYIAKAYLQQSNQLFVSRILGLSGYDAGPAWSIKTTANVNPVTIGVDGGESSSLQLSFSAVGAVSQTSSSDYTYQFDEGQLASELPEIAAQLGIPYTKTDGSTSTLRDDIYTFLATLLQYKFDNSVGQDIPLIGYWGSISNSSYANNSAFTGETNFYGVPSIPLSGNTLSDSDNDPWYYSTFTNTNGVYDGFSFYIIQTPGPGSAFNNQTTRWVSDINIYLQPFSGTSFTDYENLVVATFRSRGLANYINDNGPVYEVSGTSDVTMVCTGQYSGVTKNPFSTFKISGITKNSEIFQFETSLSTTSTNSITKVFGGGNFDKPKSEVPLFVEERYSSLLSWAYNKGYIRGLNCNLIPTDSARSESIYSLGNYLEKYQTPETPWVVSEVRGSTVYRLFKFVTISDGNGANREVKISLANMSFVNNTFDVLVRDYYDTDQNPTVIEKFTQCSMNPSLNNYIAKKIGSKDGEYALISKFIMVETNPDAPVEAIPCGFEGYTIRTYSGTSVNIPPFVVYKTKYEIPGATVFEPPFNTPIGAGVTVTTNGDTVRRTYLGISDKIGIDGDFFDYKGKINQGDLCTLETFDPWLYKVRGFHMDIDASGITISNQYLTSGTPEFFVGDATFQSEPETQDNPYYRTFARKFTVLPAGGFDGWDIYTESRTNTDRFVLGGTGYKKGACTSARYPSSTGDGMFKPITVDQNSVDYANTDYYAYLLGMQSMANPEAININVFVTPGIDYVNNLLLVNQAIGIVEIDRADSIYITTTPDYNMFAANTNDPEDLILAQDAVDNLINSDIDSNYTATYYPWVLTRDTVNNTQIYIPPTAEVTRNLALTDNIAFPWFATAGYTRGLVNSVKARRKLSQEDRDVLYQGRINPIATFSDVGTVIWGNKTLQIAESALDRINVRRLLLQARKLISAVSVRLLFEQNDDIVRQQFLSSVNPILDAIRRDRGLYDFRVTVRNTPEDLDNNRLVGSIYIKPTRALEFIDITFYITPTGASFENI
jgi:hypothetical protein